MKIYGLEKLSLVDYEGCTSAVVFTGACNFRCPFCHNGGLVELSVEQLSEKDVLLYLTERSKMLDAVCISGGEPTLDADLIPFLNKVKNLGYKVKLDTNGTSPAVLQKVIDLGLVDYVAMDVKNCLKKYEQTTGVRVDINKIKQSINILLLGKVDYEFRTTLVKEFHTEEDIMQMANEVAGARKLYLQKFNDSPTCLKQGLNEVDKQTAERYVQILNKTIGQVKLRGYV